MKKLETLVDVYKEIASRKNNTQHFNYCTPKTTQTHSTQEFKDTVRYIALGLLSRGVKKGDTIGLISQSSPEWTMFDFAFMSIGAIVVPMFETASKEHLSFQIKDAGVKKMFVAHLGHNETVQWVCEEHKLEVFSYEAQANMPTLNGIQSIEGLIKEGKEYEKKHPEAFEKSMSSATPKDVMTYIYTSGTTGQPKGVVLTHRNFISQMEGFYEILNYVFEDGEKRVACVLPLAHIYQRSVFYFFLYKNTELYYLDPRDLSLIFPQISPQVTLVVPRLLEKVYEKLMLQEKQARGIKGFIMSMAFKRAKTKDIHKPNGLFDALYDKLVYSKIRNVLGGQIQLMVSGGAALSNDIFNFLRNIGIPLDQGYGLTETSPVVSTTYSDKMKVGSVGPILPGVSVKIDEDGEILVKGDSVMVGYYKNEKETQAVFRDGWFCTGDLGRIDADGFLFITGRKKELLKASNGKYIAPVPIEEKIVQGSEFIEYAMIMADGAKFNSVLLFPGFERLKDIKKSHQLDHLSDDEFFEEPKIQKLIKKTVDTVNLDLPPWEKISRFKVIVHQLSIEGGELTPKFSLKRAAIRKKYETIIEEIYKRYS